ncbi:MAG TPA: hypothetical protein VLA24_04970 [Pseudomonadales bacterium]|nr:hypothetical protein [Pseudomonadales bacterium]
MAQHDFSIANQGFPAFRADLNDALGAIASSSSGTTAPSVPYANQLWMDTTNHILKVRNEDNDAWISVATFDQTTDAVTHIDNVELAYVVVTNAAQTFTAAQRGAISTLTDGTTITPDFAVANNFTVTLGGNRTMANPTNLAAGQSGSIFIVQDGTGSRTLAWGSYWDFTTGTAPTLTTTAGAIDRVDYIVRTTGSIHAVFTGDYS